jgi:hypothetical protein
MAKFLQLPLWNTNGMTQLKKISKQQSSSLTMQYNRQVGTQHQNTLTRQIPSTALSSKQKTTAWIPRNHQDTTSSLQNPQRTAHYLTQVFNAVLLKGYFPAKFKVTQIILIPKPANAPPPQRVNILSPNRPLTYHIQSSRKASFKKAPPNSRKKSLNTKPSIWLQTRALHDRTDKIVQLINEALECKQYCSAAFLDIT